MRALLEQAAAAAADPVEAATPDGTPAAISMPANAAGGEAASDAAFQNDLRQSFAASLTQLLTGLRAQLQTLAKSPDEPSRIKNLQDLYRSIHALTGNAGMVGMLQIAQMADALEALIKELYEKPRTITASTLRTVALAIDFLGMLSTAPNPAKPRPLPRPRPIFWSLMMKLFPAAPSPTPSKRPN